MYIKHIYHLNNIEEINHLQLTNAYTSHCNLGSKLNVQRLNQQ